MKSIIQNIMLAIIITLIVSALIKPTIVKETSMLPTLKEDDYLLVNKMAYKYGEEERGDIIIFKSFSGSHNGKERLLVKRIVGLPKEKVCIENGRVYIDEKRYNESYLETEYVSNDNGEYEVPEGHFFVMGDNRNVSIDSRSQSVGYISEDQIVGKVSLRLFPVLEIKIF